MTGQPTTGGQRGLGEPDGFGRYGVPEQTEDGLVCHECGQAHQHLGLHVARAHGVTAAAYRDAHGLKRSRGLVASAVREKIAQNARQRYSDGGSERLKAVRDPTAATAARQALARPRSAEAAAILAAAATRPRPHTRTGRVVVCQSCGAEFCPLVGAKRRRFCSRSCASRHNRAQARSSTPGPSRVKPGPGALPGGSGSSANGGRCTDTSTAGAHNR